MVYWIEPLTLDQRVLSLIPVKADFLFFFFSSSNVIFAFHCEVAPDSTRLQDWYWHWPNGLKSRCVSSQLILEKRYIRTSYYYYYYYYYQQMCAPSTYMHRTVQRMQKSLFQHIRVIQSKISISIADIDIDRTSGYRSIYADSETCLDDFSFKASAQLAVARLHSWYCEISGTKGLMAPRTISRVREELNGWGVGIRRRFGVIDSWVHSWGFELSNLQDWSWTSIAHLLWQRVKCACASHGAQQYACVVCSVCSHNCS